MASLAIDEPPNSRLFVVAGRNTSAEYLRSVFDQYGSVSFVKYLREKGVAYVKYDRASSAALAIENLHEVTLNEGQGPRLKVILADSPHTRSVTPLQQRHPTEEDNPSDPDNTPPRSRLFMVVPKSADGTLIEAEMSRFPGLQYCKTDLIATKGIVFVKYSKSSAACLVMETVQQTGMVAGYKVKVMLAEPKTRRGAVGAGFMPGLLGSGKATLGPGLLGSMGMAGQGFNAAAAAANSQLLSSLSSAGLMGQGLGMPDYSLSGAMGALSSGFVGLPGLPGSGMGGAFRGGGTPPLPGGPLDPAALSSQVNLASLGLGGSQLLTENNFGLANFSGLGLQGGMTPGAGGLCTPMTPSASAASSSPNDLSRQRLFIVVHKSVTEEALARVFRAFPGLEYCDLKRDRATGRSKGYCYVNYSSPEAAAAAQAQLNGIEYPQGTGYRLKVMFAEPLGSRTRSSGDFSADSQAGSGGAGNGAAGGATYMGTPQDGSLHLLHSPQQDNSSGTIQGLHTPLTGESGVLQGGYNLSSTDPSPGVSHETHASTQSSPLRPGMGSLLDTADLAAVQSSLAQMSLKEHGLNGLGPNGRQHQSPVSVSEGTMPKWRHQQQDPMASPEQQLPGSQSCPISPLKPLQQDESVVYSALSRPLPDYTLAHVFSQCGPVEFVRLLGDERVAMIKYASVDAARHALANLNGSEVLGELLHVRASPPLPLHAFTP